jgi:hypothetical protein
VDAPAATISGSAIQLHLFKPTEPHAEDLGCP